MSTWKNLHDLGYLPVEIKALPEGSKVPMKVPCITIVNTIPEFYWLTNFFRNLVKRHYLAAMYQRHYCTCVPEVAE